jgi:hypothetical protein
MKMAISLGLISIYAISYNSHTEREGHENNTTSPFMSPSSALCNKPALVDEHRPPWCGVVAWPGMWKGGPLSLSDSCSLTVHSLLNGKPSVIFQSIQTKHG